jgi:hypothetical protein
VNNLQQVKVIAAIRRTCVLGVAIICGPWIAGGLVRAAYALVRYTEWAARVASGQ